MFCKKWLQIELGSCRNECGGNEKDLCYEHSKFSLLRYE